MLLEYSSQMEERTPVYSEKLKNFHSRSNEKLESPHAVLLASQKNKFVREIFLDILYTIHHKESGILMRYLSLSAGPDIHSILFRKKYKTEI